ncbi:MarR family winged helix-turn-helix transcriptional regulator [Oryzifoliimicrobium ureilyticus]|uniref:MarR family winged helix-turn-helix transcriptional regulator n=1 Tax=Oryzifoliimicrobium ureilyticus TaxID=3113724 RepID=UPI00307613FC
MANLNQLQRTLTAGLLSTGRQWRRVVDKALQDHGISEACAAPLLWIGRLGEGVRQNVLAGHIGIEGPSLVRLLDQLETMELVIRKDDPADRRAKGLWLTEQGKTLAAQMEQVLDELRSDILRNIPRSDLEAALRVLDAFDNATNCAEATDSAAGGK